MDIIDTSRRLRRTPDQAREQIFVAAIESIRAEGFRGFTLDSIARRCGISKAGLIHHFPSKDALASALLEHALAQFEEILERHAASEPEGTPGRFVRAYIQTSFDAVVDPSGCSIVHLIEAAAAQPAILDTVRPVLDRWLERVQCDGIDPVRALVICHAADGCTLDVGLGVARITDERIQLVRRRLIEMSREAGI